MNIRYKESMKLEVAKFAKLREDITNASSITQLRSLRDQFQRSVQHIEQMHAAHDIADWNFRINESHDAFIRKTIALAEMSMVEEGYNAPPTTYSYILLGSGGRSEQTLASDQDSAIIYKDGPNAEELRSYFLSFTNKIVTMLMQLGYPPCDGKVQSNELMWCQSESEWKQKLENWFTDASWESIRFLLICADARSIVGDESLYRSVRSFYENGLIRHSNILERMIENTVQYKMLVGVFGQFITDRYGEHVGSIDIKYGAYIPIVNSIRWLALKESISEASTLLRIDRLLEKQVISKTEHTQYREAFSHVISLRLKAGHVLKGDGYYEANGKLNPKRLDHEEIKLFKKNLRIGKDMQRHVIREFGKLK